MEQYKVTGMSCAACSAHVEKAVQKVKGVTRCTVSLLTNSMTVEGSASQKEITNAVKHAGYSAEVLNNGADFEHSKSEEENMLTDTETPKMIKRLIFSVVLLLPLMYASMGHMMWGWYLPFGLNNNMLCVTLIQLFLCSGVMLINKKFFISGVRGLMHGAPNMDTLVALGSGVSYVYSVFTLFRMTADISQISELSKSLYFESAAMILTLITVGKTLEAHSKGKTTDAIKSLMRLAPKTAVIEKDGSKVEVPVDEVKKGDTFFVKPGSAIPCDGIVLTGESAVNEAALTGESIPADKAPGDKVSGATINQSGFLTCKATNVGQNTALAQIIEMVRSASAEKAPAARAADKVSAVFVPVVMAIAVITLIAWLIAGQTAGYAIQRAVSVLVISCPCALGLATPVAVMAGNGMGAKHGILFKSAAALETAAKINICALDKTGTVTAGEPKVTDVYAFNESEREQLILTALALEAKSEHPLSRAITSLSDGKKYVINEVSEFSAVPGNGLFAKLNNKSIAGGNIGFITQFANVSDTAKKLAEDYAEQGKTPLFFSSGGTLLGIIAVADVIKDESKKAVNELKKMGIRVVMLTGDNPKTAAAIGKQAGISEVTAGILPDGKRNEILRLKQTGKVLMAGDGINDAPALTSADVGVAVGAGTDIAIDAADVVLIKNKLTDIPAAVKLGRATTRVIHQNLFWAFIYNIIGIPLAAGVWIPLFGYSLNPMFGAFAMSLSSFCVVMNALRLNALKLGDSDKKADKKTVTPQTGANNKKSKENTKMKQTTLKVDGMMCQMCERHVNECISQGFDVKSVESSHSKGETVIVSDKDLDIGLLTSAVEKTGYKVLGVETKSL